MRAPETESIGHLNDLRDQCTMGTARGLLLSWIQRHLSTDKVHLWM